MKRGLRRGVAARARESQLISIDPDDSSSQWPPRRRGAWRHDTARRGDDHLCSTAFNPSRRPQPTSGRRRWFAVEREHGERENQQQRRASWSERSRVISPSLHLSLSSSLAPSPPPHLFSRIRDRSISAIAIDRDLRSRVYSRRDVP